MIIYNVECVLRTMVDEIEIPEEWFDAESGYIKPVHYLKFKSKAEKEAKEYIGMDICTEFEIEDYTD